MIVTRFHRLSKACEDGFFFALDCHEVSLIVSEMVFNMVFNFE
nr:MAG TPA: hypothetical protein [Caudoviricetes sp.]